MNAQDVAFRAFGMAIEQWFVDHDSTNNLTNRGQCLEDIRRDARVKIFLQCKPQHTNSVRQWLQSTQPISLGELGEWRWEPPSPSPFKDKTAYVLCGVRLDANLN